MHLALGCLTTTLILHQQLLQDWGTKLWSALLCSFMQTYAACWDDLIQAAYDCAVTYLQDCIHQSCLHRA